MKHQTWLQASANGLSPTQGQILAFIAVEGPLSASELSSRLGVTLPTVSDSVRVLVAKKLANKMRDPRHPRASLIELTANGRLRSAHALSWPEFLATAVSTMSALEQSSFLTGLMKMIRTLQENGQIPTNRMCVTCIYFRPNVHDGSEPHHCAFVDAPMAPQHLRLDCREQEEASAPQRAAAWERFLNPR
jgi:DNA-binding MarR family transcriptional regulator